MPFVSAKCTNCGANLTVDSTRDAAICEFCGSAFVVEKAINNYSIKNDIKADVVNVYGSINSDFEIEAGVLKKYKGSATSVVIPEGVIEVNADAFEKKHYITEITFPESFRVLSDYSHSPYIGEILSLFSSLKNINVNSRNSTYSSRDGVLYSKDGSILHRFPRGRSEESCKIYRTASKIESYAFSYCKNLREVIFPCGIEEVGSLAFYSCSNLSKLTCPESLSQINLTAFVLCSSLEKVICSKETIKCLKGQLKRSNYADVYKDFYSEIPWVKNKFPAYCRRCESKLRFTGKCPNCD